MVNLLGGGNGKPPSTKTRQQAISALATLVGTLVLARAAGNSVFSDEILQAGKAVTRERSDAAVSKRKSVQRTRASKRGTR